MNLMVITDQKSVINTHKTKRKDSKYNTKDSHKVIRKKSKRKNNKLQK